MFCQCDSPRSDVKSSAIKYSRPLVGNRVPVEKINVRKFESALMQARCVCEVYSEGEYK